MQELSLIHIFVVLLALDAPFEAGAGRELPAGLRERGGIAVEVRTPGGFEIGERDLDALGHPQHLRESNGAERIRAGGV